MSPAIEDAIEREFAAMACACGKMNPANVAVIAESRQKSFFGDHLKVCQSTICYDCAEQHRRVVIVTTDKE